MRDKAERAFTVEQAERVLSGPLSEDLPENIEAIDKAVGEAHLAGKLDHDLPIAQYGEAIRALLKTKGVTPSPQSEWDLNDPKRLADLSLKLMTRVYMGGSSWDLGLGEKKKERLAVYEKLKDRPSVKRIIEVGGLCQDTLLTIKVIDEIDSRLAKGETYNDVFYSIIYFDDTVSNHAFLNHVEERFKTEIKSRKQLYELAELKPCTFEEYKKDIEENGDGEEVGTREEFLATQEAQDPYLMALAARYALALDKILREGGKYKDLLAINPQSFGLPEKWSYPYDVGRIVNQEKGWGANTSKEGMILKAISLCFNLNEWSHYRIPLRELADNLEAPYSVILEASRYYD